MPALSDAGPRLQSWRPVRPPFLDIALALTFVALSIAEIGANDSVRSPLQHFFVAGCSLAVLAWRRQYPIVVAAIVVAANTLINPEHEFTTVLSLVLCCFTIGYERAPPPSYLGLAVVLIPFLAGVLRGGFVPSDVAAAVVFIVGPWAVGSGLRQRTAQARQAVADAERRVREQEQQAREAAAVERSRIARELHDIVSHSISVVTIQTQAVRRRLGPEHAAEAADLAMVEATAREAMAEMRRLFGVLRTDGESASLTPQPGLGELKRLVASVGEFGPSIRLVREGEVVPLPAGVDLTAYRIAQEGLTNALRHSGASEIVITVSQAPESVIVSVEDNGRGLSADGPAGHGLVGIRERVALYGGSVDLVDLPTGGVRLVAQLPLGEAS